MNVFDESWMFAADEVFVVNKLLCGRHGPVTSAAVSIVKTPVGKVFVHFNKPCLLRLEIPGSAAEASEPTRRMRLPRARGRHRGFTA